VMARFGDNPLLGVFVGMVVTMLIQSSSATIAIVQIMAFNGIIGFPAAITLMLGGDIGTTITAQLAAIGTSVNAKRAAMAHTLFNVVGVSIMMVFVYNGWFVRVVEFIVPGKLTVNNIMVYIAVANSIFKIANAMIFLPFIDLLEKASIFLVPKKKGTVDTGPQYLEKHLLDTPPIALEQARKETVYMLGIACRSVALSVKSFMDNDISLIKKIGSLEEAVDNLQSDITQYVIEISRKNLSEVEAEELPVLIHSVNDIERIGDHSENIIELVERRIEQKLLMTDDALKELRVMWNELNNMMIEAETALKRNNTAMAEKVLSREKRINQMQIDLKKSHVDRLNAKICNLKSGVVFLDFVDNLEKIGDHLSNIAEGILGEMRWKLIEKSAQVNKEEVSV